MVVGARAGAGAGTGGEIVMGVVQHGCGKECNVDSPGKKQARLGPMWSAAGTDAGCIQSTGGLNLACMLYFAQPWTKILGELTSPHS